ncbi:MAG: 50S ribosomal protein L15 [Actinobacteria bacterium]|jgi:large subunit ribosomal protein L15|nr:50S ribosomal protein L15 [Actinomycetota bacterium]NCW34832.1 50S ribosomal protein L15 [Actinomycetota bacterium]NDB30949.1 50S ribosomal protein L15 [Actinomycetota bacterium]NDC12905.1 50S ribosomal protein L15 [Actinomycetota bacterium]NDD60269.1 50S ribosomal protein L15 [Actinomycetota bacterium]
MVLKAHHLRPAPGAKTEKTRKGRGEASKGKTAGRGGKGTRARNVVRAGFEGGAMPLVQRLPKLRGFKNPAKIEYQPVNVSTINALFPKGGAVTVDDLYKAGAARRGLPVKVLGNGDISVKVDVAVHSFSKSASEKISAAGGSIKTL